MEVIKTEIEDVQIIIPDLHEDYRGSFMEAFSRTSFAEAVCKTNFIQDNESRSKYGVIRGLHYQIQPYAQTKLVRAVYGRILDVVVDIRRGSPTFGQHVTVELSEENRRQIFIPRGFAHGFSVLSEWAIVNYKCDKQYSPQNGRGIMWNDPDLAIDWRIPADKVILSEQDENLRSLKTADLFDYTDRLYCQ